MYKLNYNIEVTAKSLEDIFIITDLGIDEDFLLGRDWIYKYWPRFDYKTFSITQLDREHRVKDYPNVADMIEKFTEEEAPELKPEILHIAGLQCERIDMDMTADEDPGTPTKYISNRMHQHWAARHKTNKNSLRINKCNFAGPTIPSLPPQYEQFKSVFQVQKLQELPPHRGKLDHAIDLVPGAEIPNTKAFPMSRAEEKALEEYIKQMARRKFIRRSRSTGGAGVVFAAKKDSKELRICIDFRALNKWTIKNRYPIPLIESLIDKLAGAKYFVKLDLIEAYYLVRLREGDEPKTAFKTPWGLWEYLVMPFGLCNAAATFQGYIDEALKDQLLTELIAYLDDILISRTRSEI
ncbi:hypothetical protein KCU88_g7470, partial [Aureobasidium melanogenum]